MFYDVIKYINKIILPLKPLLLSVTKYNVDFNIFEITTNLLEY